MYVIYMYMKAIDEIILSIKFRVISLSLGNWYDRSSAIEVTLTNVGKFIPESDKDLLYKHN